MGPVGYFLDFLGDLFFSRPNAHIFLQMTGLVQYMELSFTMGSLSAVSTWYPQANQFFKWMEMVISNQTFPKFSDLESSSN